MNLDANPCPFLTDLVALVGFWSVINPLQWLFKCPKLQTSVLYPHFKKVLPQTCLVCVQWGLTLKNSQYIDGYFH